MLPGKPYNSPGLLMVQAAASLMVQVAGLLVVQVAGLRMVLWMHWSLRLTVSSRHPLTFFRTNIVGSFVFGHILLQNLWQPVQ